MFRFDPDYQFSWPVSFKMPLNGGKWGQRSFTVTYKYMAGKLLTTALKGAESDPQKLRSLLKEVMVSVEGIAGTDGEELDSSPDLIDQLLDVPAILNAIFYAYIQALAGVAEKN